MKKGKAVRSVFSLGRIREVEAGRAQSKIQTLSWECMAQVRSMVTGQKSCQGGWPGRSRELGLAVPPGQVKCG